MRESTLAISDEYDDQHSCPKCGNDLEWVECWMADCEDGTYDLYEEDPIFFSPGQRARCSECGGNGGWIVCRNCEKGDAPRG